MTLSIVDFLNARLADDEAAARSASEARAGAVPPEGNVLLRVRNALPGTASIEDVTYLVWCSALDAKEMMKEPDATEEHYLNKQRHVLEEARTRVALVDPARVLREVAAKRRIMERHKPDDRITVKGPYRGRYSCQGCNYEYGTIDEITQDIAECPELRDLAAIYTDHPDWREEWRPTS